MKTIMIANLKENWHRDFENLTEVAHDVLDEVTQILFCFGITTIEEAKETIENEGYYFYLPPRWDDSFDVADNLEALEDFCKLIAELDGRAYPLTIEVEDIESFTCVDVTDKFYSEVQTVDLTNIRINDLAAIRKLTNLTI